MSNIRETLHKDSLKNPIQIASNTIISVETSQKRNENEDKLKELNDEDKQLLEIKKRSKSNISRTII